MMKKPETKLGFVPASLGLARLRYAWHARRRSQCRSSLYVSRVAYAWVAAVIVVLAGVGVTANTRTAVYAAEPETPADPKGTPKVTPDSDKDKKGQETKKEEAKQKASKKRSSGRKPSGKQTPPKPADKKPKAGKSTGDPAKGVDMPADVQRQLDELFERRRGKRGADPEDPAQVDKSKRSQQKQRSGKRSPKRPDAKPPRGGDKSATPAGASTGDAAPAGPTTKLDLPPSQEAVPARQRTYSFSIKNGTYEQLLQGINRQTGQAILGEAPKDGKVTFVTDEVLTYAEMLSRVRMLLFNYKPHDPYWLREDDTHLKVVRVTDLYRELGLDRMFRSVEDFRAANLPGEELALVIYTPKSGSVARLNMLRDFLPDYVRIAPLEGRNAVTIFALVRDIEKYMQLKGIFIEGVGPNDPRTLEVIPVEHIKPSEAWVKVQSLIDLGGTSRPRPKSGGRRGREPSVLDAAPEPTVSVVPEDLQGVLIVRAMQDKIDEIKLLLPYVDVETAETFDPIIIELEHTTAGDVIPMVEQILAAAPSAAKPTSGAKRPSRPKKGRKKKRRSTSSASPAGVSNKITLIPHPRGSAIIVLASEQDVERVRDIVSIFDVQTRIGPIRIGLDHIDPDELSGTVTQLMLLAGDGGKNPDRFQLVRDPAGRGVWFSGTEDDLEQVRTIIAAVDVPEGGVTLHVIRLENRTPSFVAGLLSQYDKSGTPPTSSGSKKRGKKSRKGKSSRSKTGQGSTGKFTADDNEKRLFVLCTEEEWEGYLPIIAQLEAEIEPPGPTFTLIPVEHITPAEAVGKLKDLFVAVGEKRRGTGINSVRFEAADGAVMVVNATSDEIEQMRELLVVFDRPVEILRQVFEIHFADPDDIISAIEALIINTKSGSMASRRGGKSGGKAKTVRAIGTPEVTLLPKGNRLFVRATREKMDAIAELIEEFDVEEERTTLRVYEDFSAGTDIEQIADTLTVLMVGPKTASRKRPKGEAEQQRAKFQAIPQPVARRLIVVAQPAQFEEIEELLDILRVDIDVLAIETVFVDVQFAEPEEIVQLVSPFLQMKIQELLSSGKLKQRARPPIMLGKSKKPGGKRGSPGGGRASGAMATSWYHFEADARNRRVVIAATKIVVEEAKRLIAQFDVRTPIDVLKVETALVEVQHADPEDIIELVRPLLSLKVRELVERGELQGAVELPATARGRKPGQKRPGQKTAAAGGRSAGRTDDWFHLAADTLNHRIVIAAPRVVVDIAKELVAMFDFRPDSDVELIETALVDVHFADPDDIIDLVQPPLSMKVQELVERGVLKGEAAVASKPKPPTKGRGRGSGGAKRSGRSDDWFHLAADSWNGRVVITAPQVVIDIAKELVAKFDSRASQNEQVVKTIELHNSTAADMVKAIREMMGKPARAGGAKGKPRGKTAGGQVTPEFSIIAAPGGRAVMLRSVAELVEQAAGWITQLDSLPGGSRKIKVYELQHADPAQLVDLIMATVGTSASTPGKKGGRARTRVAAPIEEEEDMWVTKIKRSAPDLYVEADLIANTMIVAAPPAKLAEVDAIVAQFDTVEEGERRPPGVPKFVYTLEHRDPFDAELEAQSVFEALWEPSDEIPKVQMAMWGDYLVVEYPHEERFGEIEEMIRKYVDKPPEDAGELTRKAIPVPEGMSPEEVAMWVRMNNPHIDFEVKDISQRSVDDYEIEQVVPPGKRASPCVWPTALERMSRGVSTAALGLAGEVDDGDPPAKEESPGADGDPVSEAARALLGDEDPEGASPNSESSDAAKDEVRERITIYIDRERGIMFEGSREVVKEIEESIKEDLAKEIETLVVPPDIRIYRVKYIDVFTATEIINEMFNATRQQRQQIQQQQRRAQQQVRQQQQQQRRQQQQQQQSGKPGQPGQQQQRGPRGQQQQQASIPQLPPTQVRVYPNPRDRTLILRADSSQYPALLELLSTIDQPQPIESKFRTFALKKLNAVEVEEVLKDMLGLNAAQSRTRRTTPSRQGGRGGATRSGGRSTGQSGGQLPQPIMQTKADGTVGELGVDPKDIKISSNEEANTILVMAPEAALDYIGDLIEQLESQDVLDREWKTYELKYADADGVVEYLDSYYGEEGSSSKKKKKGRGSRKTGSGLRSPALNAPTFIAYPRLNLLSAQATAEQFEKIDALIEKVDVRSDREEWQTVTLARADAGMVADTLTNMFGSAAPKRKGRKGRPSASGGTEPKFIGEEGGRIVHFAASNNLREDILAVIEQIEVETERKTKPRIIQLERATPSRVVEAIESAFSNQSTGRRGGGRQRASGASGSRFTLTPHDGTKRLFVIADDATFAEIETLAKLLDVEPAMGVEFKIYPLRFADAKKIHEQMKELMADYVRMLGRDGGNLPPFSVNVDVKANALIVLGNEAIFSFVEKNLAGVDIEANQRDLPDMLMVKLESAKAQEVAQTINKLWSTKNLLAGQTPPVAEGNVALNTLIVRGTESQIEEIRKKFVEPLEENAAPSLLTETFILQYAQPDTVADLINLIYEDKAKAIKALGRETTVQPMEYTVAATPDTTTRQVVVQASEKNMEQIRKRIAELDTKENAAGGIVRVVTLKFGDATEVQGALQEALKKPGARGQELAGNVRISALAQSNAVVITGSRREVERIEQQVAEMDEAGRARAIPQMIVLEHAKVVQVLPTVQEMFTPQQQRGRRRGGAEPPVITANEAMNVLLVRASPSDFSAIEAVVRKLDTEKLGEQESFRIIQITQGVNITDLADKVEQAVNDSAEKQYAQVSGGVRGGRGGRRGGGTRRGGVGRSRVRSVMVRPDPRTNSLIVSGSPELFDYVEELAKAMEKMGPPQGRGTRIIQVSNRKMDDLMRVIDQLTQRQASSQRTSRTGRGSSARTGRTGRSSGRRSPGSSTRSGSGSRRSSGQRGR